MQMLSSIRLVKLRTGIQSDQHLYNWPLPVYITYGGTNLPSALTHTFTVMFSLPEPPMIAWGDLTPRLHTICAGLETHFRPH